MEKYHSLIYNHTTTWHDGCVALLLPNEGIVSLAAERVDRIRHSWNSKTAYEFLKDRFPDIGFGTENDNFRDVSGGLEKTGHHLYHAASTFFGSGFKESGILVIDGQGPERGKLAFTSIWEGRENKIDLIEMPFANKGRFASRSIGHFYTAIGAIAGMQSLYEEGKTMGLAAYGKPSPVLDFIKKYIFSNSDGSYNIEPDFIYAILGNTFGPKYYGWKRQPKRIQDIWKDFMKVRGRPLRQAFEDVSQEDTDTAYAGQFILEELVLGLAKRVKSLTGKKYLCLAGGVALNGLSNSKIVDSELFDDVFIFPAAGDDGQAIGKLFYNLHDKGIGVDTKVKNAFYGPEYSQKEIKETIKKFRKEIKIVGKGENFTIDEVVERLTNGEVIGRFAGSSEIGPRALGNRSIIADPRIEEMRNYINKIIKNREWYRPFAPAVTEEDSQDYFDLRINSPFMLFVGKVKPLKRKIISSVTHIDNSARVQTVSKIHNPLFYRLIKAFGNKTGVPVILNTSFNRRNEPIVETPQHAVESFLHMDLDALILCDHLIEKIS